MSTHMTGMTKCNGNNGASLVWLADTSCLDKDYAPLPPIW